MNPILRTLEEWTTHQDYLWFLAMLAWGAVLGAEYPGKRAGGDRPARAWLMVFAGCCLAGAALELVLLAQHLNTPYTRFDLAMGVAQAAGTAALIWGATAGWRHRFLGRSLAFIALTVLAGARASAPLGAGLGLALVHVGAVLGLVRTATRPLSVLAVTLLVALPVIATHGPWAYAMAEGRRNIDWSHFALPAAIVSLAAGTTLAVSGWRRRLPELVGEAGLRGTLRRDLRWAVVSLAAWLAGGVLLAVWYGRIARRAFEENLMRRVETAVLALDEQTIVKALGPELRITALEQRRYRDGRPVTVATAPHTREPVYAALRTQLARVRENNPDFKLLYVATWREGRLLVLNSLPRRGEAITHVIHHDVVPADLERLAEGKSFLEGPITSESWLPQFSAKAPLRDPVNKRLLGWLVADVEATRWMATFTQTRLQTMALVGAGVGLWTLAVAYRLRREARDAAEQKATAAAGADRMKSAFLAKVSHELRTPIQSVLGYGELLDRASLTEKQRGWLTALRSHGDIMLRLVNDLIDLGALQSGAFQLDHGPVAIRSLVGECAAALQPAVNAKGLAFRTEIAVDVPGWVRVDGVRLRQILLNLLTNAVKFTPAGSVVLAVQRGDVSCIEFVVTDTGPGISAALRPRLFQPFARLDPAAGGGSGLGLALVQGICTVMGGSVALVEQGGPGTTFVVRLPLPRCEPTPTESTAVDPGAPSFAGRRILIAEDNTLVRELLTAFLSEHGANVTVAADGNTALTFARARAFDVLLLDIALPGMDGIAVAETLRREGSRLRIIGLSAHVAPQDEARARDAGMDMFLPKPVRLARLADAILAQPSPANGAEMLAERISDENLRQRLVSQFADETPRMLAEMRAALIATDWPRLRSRAHYLKNSADILGAKELQVACHRLASLGEPCPPGAARELLEAIERAIPVQLTSANPTAVDRN